MSAHRSDIQGLRGLAVLAVVVFHAAPGVLGGGFAGVDIFFVISGYLITRILLRDMDAGEFSLADFYRRRVRRLFPALYVMLAAVLALGLLILPPKLLSELVYTQFFTTLFASNFAFAHLSGYFDSEAGLKPLLHTWSLGVEEQYYLLFPLLLMALRRFLRPWLWWILVGLAGLSLVAGLAASPEAAFYLPTTRAFELLIGALCVHLEPRLGLSDKLRRQVSLAGLFLVVTALIWLKGSLAFPAPWALWPCLGAACLLVAPGGFGGRLLSAPPLIAVGDLSYSLYLWHWPLLVMGRLVFGDIWWVALGAVVTAGGLSWLSWRYVETPCLEMRRHIFVFGGLAMAGSIIACLAIYGLNGVPQRFNATEQAAFAASDDFNHRRGNCHLDPGVRVDYRETCVYGKGAATVAVWGDSHGAELAQAIGNLGGGVRQITASACPPSVGYEIAYNPTCRAHNADMLLHLKLDKAVTTVVLLANYQRYAVDHPDRMLSGLELAALDLKSAGKRVVVVEPVPVYGFDPPSQVGLAMRLGRDPGELGVSREVFERANGQVIAELEDFTAIHGIEVLRPADVLCGDGFCHVWRGGVGVLYFNGQHLSVTGAGLLAAEIAQ